MCSIPEGEAKASTGASNCDKFCGWVVSLRSFMEAAIPEARPRIISEVGWGSCTRIESRSNINSQTFFKQANIFTGDNSGGREDRVPSTQISLGDHLRQPGGHAAEIPPGEQTLGSLQIISSDLGIMLISHLRPIVSSRQPTYSKSVRPAMT